MSSLIARIVAACLGGIMVACAMTAPTSANAASTQEAPAEISVRFDDISPGVVTVNDETLNIRATVSNPSDAPVSGGRLTLAVGNYALNQRDQIQAWAEGEENSPTRLWTLASAEVPTIEARSSREVTLEAHLSDVGSAVWRRFGGHPLRVSFEGIHDEEAVAAKANSFLLVDTPGTYKPTPLLVVTDLTASASTLKELTASTGAGRALTEDDFLPDTPAGTPAPGIADLKQALTDGTRGTTFVVDPALYDATSPLNTSSLAARRTLDVTSDAATVTASQSAIEAGADVTLGLWGAPDASLGDTIRTSVFDAALERTRRVARALESSLTLPHTLALSPTARVSAPAGTTWVVPDTAVRTAQQRYIPDARVSITRGSNADAQTVLLSDTPTSRALSSTGSSLGGRVAALQLAATLLAQHNAERPNDPRLLVLTVPPEAAALVSVRERRNALFALPWVTPTSLDEALEGEARSQATPTDELVEPADLAAASTRLSRTLSRIGSSAEHANLISEPLLWQRAFATSRVLGDEDRRALTARLRAATERVSQSVRAKAPPSINVISRSAEVPVQVRNDLPYPVRVRISLQPAAASIVTTTSEVRVAGRSSATVQVPLKATANGNVHAALLLQTPRGQALTESTTITLRVHQGFEDRFLLVLAALVVVAFALGLARSILRGRRTDPDATRKH
ncbi:MAG: DUF6049 family protein [Actinomycetaceae bacterium]|nr:DUF6049 family protein [Actinomycetaceae bacterium]